MFDEFLEDYKYNWKMADKQYMEERYRESLSPKQREKATRSSATQNLMGAGKFKIEDGGSTISRDFSNGDGRVFNFPNSFDCVVGMEYIGIRDNIV